MALSPKEVVVPYSQYTHDHRHLHCAWLVKRRRGERRSEGEEEEEGRRERGGEEEDETLTFFSRGVVRKCSSYCICTEKR